MLAFVLVYRYARNVAALYGHDIDEHTRNLDHLWMKRAAAGQALDLGAI